MVESPKYLSYLPNVLWPSDLEEVPLDQDLVKQVEGMMTPQALLQLSDFETPEIISPEKYSGFEDLVRDREKVRRLKLLPIKTAADRAYYHSIPKDILLERVMGYLGSSPMALAPNLYPDNLPLDLRQSLLWVKDNQVDDYSIHEFIARSMTVLDLKANDLLLFERSTKTRSKIVRGTFPELRHIHFWSRIKP